MYKASSKKKWLSLILYLFLIFSLALSLVSGIGLADDGPKQFVSPYETIFIDENGNQITRAIFPLGPQVIRAAVANVPDVNIAGAINSLLNVPAFDWSYGCSATSAAMLFGYYDRIGYSNMYTGPTNSGVCPLDNSVWGHTTYPNVTCGEMPLSATHNGIDGRAIKGHVDDYWIDYDNDDPDPYLGNWAEHTLGDSTGDYMGTNQAKFGNTDGSTTFYWYTNGDPLYDYTGAEPSKRDGSHGMKLFADSRSYTVVTNFCQLIQGQGSDLDKGFNFTDFQSEIDAGRPVLIHVVGHTMLGFGYNTEGNIIYIHDTWDYSDHTMIWGETYAYMQHRAVTVIQLQPLAPTVTTQAVSSIAATTATGNGNVTDLGVPNPTQHGVVWKTSTGPTTADNKTTDGAVSAAGTFTSSITNLSAGTLYYVRAYATNDAGTVYGDEVTFTAQYITISGTVTDASSNGIEEVTMTFATDGGGTETTTTLEDGTYSYSVSYDWSGTVTPAKVDYSFDPTNKTYTNVTTNQTQNFTATLITYALTINSGTGGTTDPEPGALSYNSGTEVAVTATPDEGYEFTAWTGDVPEGHENDNPLTVTIDSDKTLTVSFSVKTYTLSGSVSLVLVAGEMNIQEGLSGVLLSGLPDDPQTDEGGNYTAIVNHNWSGTVTPTKAGYTYSPATKIYTNVISDQTSQDYTAILITPPKISLSLTQLNFGATTSGTCTPDQEVRLSNTGGGILDWTLTDNATWLTSTPASGSEGAVLTFSASPSGLSEGNYKGSVTITSTSADNSPQTIEVTLNVKDPSDTILPFGSFDTPIDGTSGITGAVPVTGWVVDDIGVESVKVYRDPVAGEDTEDRIYIGDAMFVEGARADVEQAYPDYPMNYQAGWGYMLLTNFLPDQGNGTYRIHAYATDIDGHTISLGTKTITCDNANAIKPFGAIDTPTQGGTVTGPFFNSGWALTPMPNKIPEDGSTIYVWVDGVRLGNPAYNQYRNDIAKLFPGYENTDGAVGAYYLDTTTYENGVHTIAWSVKDNAGNSDGIGSRFFTIQNTGGSAPLEIQFHKEDLSPSISFESILNMPVNFDPIKHKRGYREDIELRRAKPDEYGKATIEIREVERIEIELGKGVSTGFLVVGDKPRALPIGSTLDVQNGKFYWQPGPGFIGEYDLIFIKTDKFGMQRKIQLKVKIRPKFGNYNIDFFKNSKAKGKAAELKDK